MEGIVNDRKLSTIEQTVLGIVWKRGPCTIYAVTKELSNSTSAFYKERASTVYPAAQRLMSLGYIEPTGEAGARKDRLVQINANGLKALERWLSEPIVDEVASHTVDLIRLRVFYLGTLSSSDRLEFLETSRRSLKAHLDRCHQMITDYEKQGDRFSALATMGVVFETEARLNWLNAIESECRTLAQGPPKNN